MKDSGKRGQLRRKNRQALIDAALMSIADLGIAGTSVSEIVSRAGLSRGMIHLHFGGKDGLLDAAVKEAGRRYYASLDSYLSAAGASPQGRIKAVVCNDLCAAVLNPRQVAIWHAFRGAAPERAEIAAHSDTRHARLAGLVRGACLEIARASDREAPESLAQDAAYGTLALLEGMWTDYLIHADTFSRPDARRVIFRFLGGLFPGYFALTDLDP